MTQTWYAIHSKPNREDLLWSQLLSRGHQVYYPRIHVRPVNPRARTIKPYFPGYLFVQLDLNQTPISTVAWTPGAQRIVSFDGEPAIVPEAVIHALQAHIQKLEAAGPDPLHGLQPGDAVVLQGGPFEGYEGILDTRLDGRERVRILLKMINSQQVRMEVSARLLERKPTRQPTR